MKKCAHQPTWTSGKCSYRDCPMTLVMYIGGEQWVCWLHALVQGLVRR